MSQTALPMQPTLGAISDFLYGALPPSSSSRPLPDLSALSNWGCNGCCVDHRTVFLCFRLLTVSLCLFFCLALPSQSSESGPSGLGVSRHDEGGREIPDVITCSRIPMWPAQAQVAFMQVTGDWVSGDLGCLQYQGQSIWKSTFTADYSW
jgi:hypothetical protein